MRLWRRHNGQDGPCGEKPEDCPAGGKGIGKYNLAKHFRLHISDDHFFCERDTASIEKEAAMDDLYVIRTTIPTEEMAAEEAVYSCQILLEDLAA